MDRITTIGRWQWRIFWRRFNRAGNLNAGNQGILLIFSVLILARYLQSLRTAAIDLPRGQTRVFESLLFFIFLAWLFPLVNNARASITFRKLVHLPLSHNELFVIRLVTLFIPPYSWIILAGSLAICYPIIRAPNPLAGVIAAGLFIAGSAFTGLSIAQLLGIGVFRKVFFAVLLLSGLAIFYSVESQGTAHAFSLLSFLPGALVSRVVTRQGALVALFELGTLTIVAFLAALWSFRRSLEVTTKPRSQKITIFDSLRIPGPVGGLAAKDFRYFRRLLDPYLGVLATALGCLYMLAADVASSALFQIFLLAVFVCNSSLAFNLFGLDNRAAMDRLKLLPVTANTILFSKNVAYLMIVGVQVLPLILLTSWRMGLDIGVFGVVETAALAAMHLAWGNWMSVNFASKMYFFQFASSNGTLVEAIAGIGVGSLPGIFAIYSLQTAGFGAAWKFALILLFSTSFYFVSFFRAVARFAQKQETITNALS